MTSHGYEHWDVENVWSIFSVLLRQFQFSIKTAKIIFFKIYIYEKGLSIFVILLCMLKNKVIFFLTYFVFYFIFFLYFSFFLANKSPIILALQILSHLPHIYFSRFAIFYFLFLFFSNSLYRSIR